MISHVECKIQLTIVLKFLLALYPLEKRRERVSIPLLLWSFLYTKEDNSVH